MRYDDILPCFIIATIADQVKLLWGIRYTDYTVTLIPAITRWTLLVTFVAGIALGLDGMLFANATHRLFDTMKKRVAYAPLRPFIGGAAVAVAVWALGTHRYIGLGIPTIVETFQQPLAPWDFAGKMVFTITSLGTGFKGGELTPLFYIGATLGNALAPLLQLPFSTLAALGFVAVFAGAANTPLASTVMAIKLLGPAIGSYAAIACVVSYLFSGHTGIYRPQRIGHAKHHRHLPEGMKLSDISAYLKELSHKSKHD